jgi:hypothetical protein
MIGGSEKNERQISRTNIEFVYCLNIDGRFNGGNVYGYLHLRQFTSEANHEEFN